MYNRYLPNAPKPENQRHPGCSCSPGANRSTSFLGGRLQLDMDTVIALAVIWFLLADGEVVQTDVLIIVAVLFLLGL